MSATPQRIKYTRKGVVIYDRMETQEEADIRAKKAEELFKRTHPEGAPKISGCCDSVKNYES